MVLRLGRRAGCSPIWTELPFKGFPTSEEIPPSPCVERAPFGSYPKAFELLKGHLAVSSRTQTSAFGRMRELPSKAVRENTDRQTSSSGCKIRVKWKTGKGYLPVPPYATLCQRLPVIRETIRVPTFYCLFAPTNQKASDKQSVGRLRETHAPIAIGWLQPTLGCPFLRLYLRKENWQSQPAMKRFLLLHPRMFPN